MLREAGQPEILRALRRDETFQKLFNENVSEVFRSLFGTHFWIKYKESTKILSEILYRMMTTMSNLQTLGEEYTGMLQVNRTGNALPKKSVFLLEILLNQFGEKMLINGLKKFEHRLENLSEEQLLRQNAREKLLQMSNVLRICIPYFSNFHRAAFYFNGHYYSIPKRICGIKYMLVRYWLKNTSTVPAFKILGIVTFIQSTLQIIFTILNYSPSIKEQQNEIKVSSEPSSACDKCSLCLCARQSSSVTPCGHLFCWPCIVQWLQEQSKCPLCRQVFQPSRIVFLQNY